MRLIWQDAMCVCAKRKEAGRQATEKEIEKRKGRDEEGKKQNKTKAKNKNKKQTRMLKTQTEIQHSSLDVPLVKKRVRRRVRMMKSVVFSASLFTSGQPRNCLSRKFHSARDRGVEDSAQLHGRRSDLQKEERVWPPSQNSAQYERVVEL